MSPVIDQHRSVSIKAALKAALGRHPVAAWLVLFLSLLVTGWAWYVSEKAVTKTATERFESEAHDVATSISNRMKEYELVLRAGSALFDASNDVTREDWSAFADTIYLQKYFPGIQALGVSVMLLPEQLDKHIADIRAEGFADYDVKPEGERKQYSAITYIEPFDWRNQRAFGYDMFSDHIRKEAMERARRTGEASASGRVILVQETGEDVQYGFLMYYPVYRKNVLLANSDDRVSANKAFVYAAFRMRDLMVGILGKSQGNIGFELYDSSLQGQKELLYLTDDITQSSEETQNLAESLGKEFELSIAGRRWLLSVYAKQRFIPLSEKYQPVFIVLVGIMLDIFLFYLISYLVRGRNLARNTAMQAVSDREISRQRMLLAAQAAGMGLGEWNISDNKLYWDDRMLALYGFKKAEFDGDVRTWQKRVHPEDMPEVKRLIEYALKFNDRLEFQFRICLPSGKTRHIAASFIIERNKSDTAVRMVGFNRDVTEQKLAEIAINEKNWRLQNVLEGTNVGSWEWNVKTGETKFNERWAEIIGYRLSELQPVSIETWLQFAHPDDLKRSEEQLQKHFDGKQDYYHCESRMRHRDGHWVWVLDRGKVFSWDEEGKPVLMFGTHQDITEQKNYQALLEEARDKAELANQARGEFLANMSHEIRTPINGVIGTLNLLSDSPLSPSQQNLVNVSKRSADALLGLINDILDLSKMESGKLTMVDEQVDVLSVINDAALSLASRAEAKGLELLCPSHFLPSQMVVTDGLRLRQVLSNLLSNAVKFTEKGSVTVTVVTLEQSKSDVTMRFSVKDTGAGIPESKQQQLFSRFQQLDNSLTRREGGTGLGLAICKQILDLMGGRIGVHSEPGKGSTFWFEVSFKRTDEQAGKSFSPFDDLSVTVVGASPLYQHFYQSLFPAWQIQYHLVADCETAVKAIASDSNHHHALLIDAEAISDNEDCLDVMTSHSGPSTALIVTCPQSMLHALPHAITQRADLIVGKPVLQSELYNALLSVVKSDNEVIQPSLEPALYQQFAGHVLVVEDNPTNVIIVKGLLEKFGLDITVAENGLLALKRLHEQVFDLVLMDCQMPEMDGYEATRQLRRDSSVLNNSVAVIALTAHAMREDERLCLDAGMDDYLSKPVDPQLLNQKLSQWLPPKCLRQFAS